MTDTLVRTYREADFAIVDALDGRVVGTTMAGYDSHQAWLYSVAVAAEHRRQGIGEMLVRAAEIRLRALKCIKVNLQVRIGNEGVAEFYRGMGYGEDAVKS